MEESRQAQIDYLIANLRNGNNPVYLTNKLRRIIEEMQTEIQQLKKLLSQRKEETK